MKKLFTYFILLFLPIAAKADIVGLEDSRKAAESFFGSISTTRSGATELVASPTVRTASVCTDQLYYIYNNSNGGFVIIAGDDCVQPVIGYATDRTLDPNNFPENLRSWLGMWENMIVECRKTGEKDPEAAESWTRLLSGSSVKQMASDELLLETAEWNQGAPYNLHCPVIGGSAAPTGCTATATAIIMRYHEWPDAGVGTVAGYSNSTKNHGTIQINGFTLGNTYDWSKMPLKYNNKATTEEKEQVATLMYQLGVMIKSHYDTDGTGSHAQYVRSAITQYMKYDKSIRLEEACYYTKKQWVAMIKENLKKVGPVHYSGWEKTGGGHAFVADGFDASDNIHINWGWGGSGNGYYQYPAISTFTEGQLGLFDMCKDHGGKAETCLVLDSYNSGRGLTASISEFTTGCTFKLTAKNVYNNSSVNFAGLVGVGRFNAKDELVEICASQTFNLSSGYLTSVTFSTVQLNADIHVGEYIALIYKADGAESWKQMPYDQETTGFVGVIYISDQYSIEETTTLLYTVETGICEITTKEGVLAKLLSPSSSEVTSGVQISGTKMTIDAKELAPAQYTLVLSKGEEYKEIKLTLGLKM